MEVTSVSSIPILEVSEQRLPRLIDLRARRAHAGLRPTLQVRENGVVPAHSRELWSCVLGNLDRAVADLADVAAKLDRGQGTLGKLVNDPSLYHEARGLVGSVRESWWLRLMGGGHASDTPSTPPAPAAEPAGREPTP